MPAGHHLRARKRGAGVLFIEPVEVLVSDLKLAGSIPRRSRNSAQAHRACSSGGYAVPDTQAPLELINQAPIFRYLPADPQVGLFVKGSNGGRRAGLVVARRSLPGGRPAGGAARQREKDWVAACSRYARPPR